MPPSLTRQEAALLRLVANGATYREAAIPLRSSNQGVKNKMQRIAARLESRNGVQTIATALRLKLID